MDAKHVLIDCPACGRRVSREAIACPECAHPIAGQHGDQVETSAATFRPLSFGLSKTVAGLLWAAAFLYTVATLRFLLTWVTWQRWVDGAAPSEVWAHTEGFSVAVWFIALFVSFIVGILFIVWLFPAYRSAESRQAVGRRWSRWWAIGSWFIPFANLVLPKLVVNEVDRMANPLAGDPPIGQQWRSLRRLGSSDWWWIALLSGVGLTFIGWTVYNSKESFSDDEAGIGYLILVVGTAALAGAAALAGVVTLVIGRRLTGQPTPTPASVKAGSGELRQKRTAVWTAGGMLLVWAVNSLARSVLFGGSGGFIELGAGIVVLVVAAFLIVGRRWARMGALVLAGIAAVGSVILAVAEAMEWSAAVLSLAAAVALMVLLTGRSSRQRTAGALVVFVTGIVFSMALPG